ncbi:MAG: SCO family protein [Candidatus Zixiibacteriota bacterium]
MKNRKRHPDSLGALLLLLCAVGFGLLAPGSAQAQIVRDSVPQLQAIDVIDHAGDYIPLDLTFTDEAGSQITLKELFRDGRPVLLTLGYYECPMLCNLVLNGLTSSVSKLAWTPGEEFQIVTVSIDPTEIPDLAAAKKKNYWAELTSSADDAGWRFLVGEESQSKALADAVGFQYYYDKTQDQYAHPGVVFVLTGKGKISRYLYGIEYKPNDLKLSLLEAAEGKIGTPMEKLILYCYHYDPDAGAYVVFASNVMRLGGALTLALMVAILGTLWIRERRRKVSIGRTNVQTNAKVEKR